MINQITTSFFMLNLFTVIILPSIIINFLFSLNISLIYFTPHYKLSYKFCNIDNNT